jgi:hypothetical protein
MSSKPPARQRPAGRKAASRPVVGWREWVGLPELGIDRIKAKIDTGARSSSLHAEGLEEVERDGRRYLRFTVHPDQRSRKRSFRVEAPLVDSRSVRSSSGIADHRPVVRIRVQIGPIRFPIEVTLARRDRMGFRMLLGRTAIRKRFVVDPGRSYLQSLPDPEAPTQ